jgi:hypothetical protein
MRDTLGDNSIQANVSSSSTTTNTRPTAPTLSLTQNYYTIPLMLEPIGTRPPHPRHPIASAPRSCASTQFQIISSGRGTGTARGMGTSVVQKRSTLGTMAASGLLWRIMSGIALGRGIGRSTRTRTRFCVRVIGISGARRGSSLRVIHLSWSLGATFIEQRRSSLIRLLGLPSFQSFWSLLR